MFWVRVFQQTQTNLDSPTATEPWISKDLLFVIEQFVHVHRHMNAQTQGFTNKPDAFFQALYRTGAHEWMAVTKWTTNPSLQNGYG